MITIDTRLCAQPEMRSTLTQILDVDESQSLDYAEVPSNHPPAPLYLSTHCAPIPVITAPARVLA